MSATQSPVPTGTVDLLTIIKKPTLNISNLTLYPVRKMPQTDLIIHDEKDNVAVVVIGFILDLADI